MHILAVYLYMQNIEIKDFEHILREKCSKSLFFAYHIPILAPYQVRTISVSTPYQVR